MKRFPPVFVPDTSPIPGEEYQLFKDQPETVHTLYRIARTSIAIPLPFFSVAGMFFPRIALALALAVGAALFILLQKKYGKKGASAPGIASLAGVGIGFLLLSPLVPLGVLIREAFSGY